MSFHGGLIGSIIGMFLFAKKYKVNFLRLTDVLAVTAPVGLFFGRIANFINLELYGRQTNGDFGVVFPNAGPYPRHPSQLYEAFLEGIILFLILFFLSKSSKINAKKGILSGLLLIFYGIFRIIIENFREADVQIGYFNLAKILPEITMGQILSLPIIIFGVFVIILSQKLEKNK
jgi:phosphatidylglycerol:prolipoprotein diacylglycerol transferase